MVNLHFLLAGFPDKHVNFSVNGFQSYSSNLNFLRTCSLVDEKWTVKLTYVKSFSFGGYVEGNRVWSWYILYFFHFESWISARCMLDGELSVFCISFFFFFLCVWGGLGWGTYDSFSDNSFLSLLSCSAVLCHIAAIHIFCSAFRDYTCFAQASRLLHLCLFICK